jgi:hypothetical protein
MVFLVFRSGVWIIQCMSLPDSKLSIEDSGRGTDRDTIRLLIDVAVDLGKLDPEDWEEKDWSIIIKGGNKYMFLQDGRLKSVIKGGQSYGPDGASSSYASWKKKGVK